MYINLGDVSLDPQNFKLLESGSAGIRVRRNQDQPESGLAGIKVCRNQNFMHQVYWFRAGGIRFRRHQGQPGLGPIK